jgi:hypothetical protein
VARADAGQVHGERRAGEPGVLARRLLEPALHLVDQLLRLVLAAERPAGEQGLLLPRGGAVGVLVGLRQGRRDAGQLVVDRLVDEGVDADDQVRLERRDLLEGELLTADGGQLRAGQLLRRPGTVRGVVVPDVVPDADRGHPEGQHEVRVVEADRDHPRGLLGDLGAAEPVLDGHREGVGRRRRLRGRRGVAVGPAAGAEPGGERQDGEGDDETGRASHGSSS